MWAILAYFKALDTLTADLKKTIHSGLQLIEEEGGGLRWRSILNKSLLADMICLISGRRQPSRRHIQAPCAPSFATPRSSSYISAGILSRWLSECTQVGHAQSLIVHLLRWPQHKFPWIAECFLSFLPDFHVFFLSQCLHFHFLDFHSILYFY